MFIYNQCLGFSTHATISMKRPTNSLFKESKDTGVEGTKLYFIDRELSSMYISAVAIYDIHASTVSSYKKQIDSWRKKAMPNSHCVYL